MLAAATEKIMKSSVDIEGKCSQITVIKTNYRLLANPSSEFVLMEMLGYH